MIIDRDLGYILLLAALFLVPRFLQHWHVPAAISALALGAAAGMGFGLFQDDATISLLSTLGIVSLFLFAGLEVDFAELRRGARMLLQHLVVRVLMVAGIAWAATVLLQLSWRPAILVALALATPSTGFILDSLDALRSSENERFWIRSKAIAVELVALTILFVDLRSTTMVELGISVAALAGLVAFLPLAFSVFATRIAPIAPKSDFSFLVILAVAAAVVTKKLGVYYLVGAFVVGIVAHRFREKMPSMRDNRMLHAVEALASLFVPFYFFHAGLELRREDFSLDALLLGAAFCLLALPLRLLVVGLHRRILLKESFADSLRVTVPLLPTLVFTLVLAGILRTEFQISPAIFGGLIIYALVNTMLPTLILKRALPDYDQLRLPPVGASDASVSNGPEVPPASQSPSGPAT
ncbi:MAG: cation:proton antiporter [Steroidobacteraceae bacterium]